MDAAFTPLDQPYTPFRETALTVKPKTEERLKTRYALGGKQIAGKFWFLPYADSLTSETETMRAAYKGMLRSPYVKSPLMMKVNAVASLDYQVIPNRPDSPRDVECAEFLRHCIDRLPGGMPALVHAVLLPTLIDGYSISERVLEIERSSAEWRGKCVPKMVKPKHTDYYDLQVDEFNNVIGVQGKGANNANEYYAISDFIYTRHMPVFDEPKGMSDLRAAYSDYWMLDTVTKLRAIHNEKYTTPFLKGSYASDDQQASLEDALASAKANTWISIPEGAQVEAVNMAGQGESDYKSFCDDCKRGMLIAIIGAYLQVLEGQVPQGRGNADVSSKDVTSLFLWMLASQFQEVINKQFFPDLVAYNYAGLQGGFRLVLGGVSEDETAKIVGNASALQAMGYPISKEDLSRRTSWGQAKNDADKLQPPQPAQQSPFGGGALPFSEEPKPKEVERIVVPVEPPMPAFSEESPLSPAARRARRRARGEYVPFAEDGVAAKLAAIEQKLAAPDLTPDPRLDKLSEQVAELATKRERIVTTKLLRDADGRIDGKEERVVIE